MKAVCMSTVMTLEPTAERAAEPMQTSSNVMRRPPWATPIWLP